MNTESQSIKTISSLEQTTGAYLTIKKRYTRCMFDYLLTFIKEDSGLIAEIGPGLGHFALECKKRGFDYIGFEPSQELRDALLKKNINVIDAYVPPIPLEPNSCDLIYASMILEHLPTYNEAGFFLNEISRVLNNDSFVCLVVPNYLTVKEFFFEMDYSHSFVTTKRRVTNLLRDAGIKVIDVQHVIGWFWVRSTFFHHILRHFINTIMVPVHFGFTTWVFEYLGQEKFLWKIRKTFFESLIITGKKTRDSSHLIQ